jgi:UDP-N-acetylmuramate dehydrogenase
VETKTGTKLSEYVTFKIGGPAAFFAAVRSAGELREAAAFAREKGMPLFVLGGGSNTVFPDEGFPGLVAKMEIMGVAYEDAGDTVRVTAGAGEDWDAFVGDTVARGLSGLENLSLIPGTVGAAPIQNIGAYGVEVSRTIESVEALDLATGETRTLTNAECAFGYRDSAFKHAEGKGLAVLSVTFVLRKDGIVDSSYKDVAQYAAEHGIAAYSPATLREAVVAIRTAKLPDVNKVGTAGSFFKNPTVTKEKYAELAARFPGIPGFLSASGVKVPLAWILDHVCGLKGEREGNVGTHTRQPLAIVNFGGATARELMSYAERIAGEVKSKTGIAVEMEIVFARA